MISNHIYDFFSDKIPSDGDSIFLSIHQGANFWFNYRLITPWLQLYNRLLEFLWQIVRPMSGCARYRGTAMRGRVKINAYQLRFNKISPKEKSKSFPRSIFCQKVNIPNEFSPDHRPSRFWWRHHLARIWLPRSRELPRIESVMWFWWH